MFVRDGDRAQFAKAQVHDAGWEFVPGALFNWYWADTSQAAEPELI